jgi:hypothetical protein
LATQPATRAFFLAPPLQAAPGRTRPNLPDGFDRPSAFAAASDAGASHVSDFQIIDVHEIGADAAGVGARALPAFGAATSDAAQSGQASSGQVLPPAASTFLAQQFTQESLSDGIYIDPHPAGIAAYRDVLNAVAIHDNTTTGVDLHV